MIILNLTKQNNKYKFNKQDFVFVLLPEHKMDKKWVKKESKRLITKLVKKKR